MGSNDAANPFHRLKSLYSHEADSPPPSSAEERRFDEPIRAALEGLRNASASMSADVRLRRAGVVRSGVATMLESLRTAAAGMSGDVRFHNVGIVRTVGSGVATISGLVTARTDEVVTFPNGTQGLVLNLGPDEVDAILLGPDEGIHGGDVVMPTGHRLRLPVGHGLLGRVINPLGAPLDGQPITHIDEMRHLERGAPSIVDRAPVNTPLLTGTKIIDALIPIGRGQRELIVGDRQTGKTTLAIDAIISQKDTGVRCVYVGIAQKKSSLLSVMNTLAAHGAMAHTTIVVASPEDPPALRYLAPYAGCAVAEFFMDAGHDALIVYDDLSKHAEAYRELSLLLKRPPGREAYPGDVFYIHARLLERSSRLAEHKGGGSLAALPIIQTQSGDLTSYIPTNVVAICDGQIVLDSALYNQGIRPAVNVGLSVSRVGGEAQPRAMRQLAGALRLELAQYEEVSRFARFGTEVDEETQRQIRRGERLRLVLTQPPNEPVSLAGEIIILLATIEGILDDIELDQVPAFERGLVEYVCETEANVVAEIERTGELEPDARAELHDALIRFRTQWTRGSMS